MISIHRSLCENQPAAERKEAEEEEDDSEEEHFESVLQRVLQLWDSSWANAGENCCKALKSSRAGKIVEKWKWSSEASERIHLIKKTHQSLWKRKCVFPYKAINHRQKNSNNCWERFLITSFFPFILTWLMTRKWSQAADGTYILPLRIKLQFVDELPNL